MNKLNLVNSNARIWCTTALFLAALIRLVQAESINQTQQGDIQICVGNYNDCINSCKTVFGSADDVDRRNKCMMPCRPNLITCINGTIQYVAPGQPGQTQPPNATGPNSTPTPTPPRKYPVKGPPRKLGPNPTPAPTPRGHPIKGPPHKLGPSPSPTAKPILLAKPKPTPSPKPTPKKSSHGNSHH
jgi:hypothetical protein